MKHYIMTKRSVEDEADVWILRLIGLYLGAFLLDVVLLIFVLLREDPVFWKNSGGYPLWLRELVLETVYPLIFVQFIVLGLATVAQFFVWRLERSVRLIGLLVVVGLWLFLGVIGVIMVWNNIDNLLNGRDLHYHPA